MEIVQNNNVGVAPLGDPFSKKLNSYVCFYTKNQKIKLNKKEEGLMKLDFFNELKNNIKENEVINNFLEQLSNYLEKNSNKNLDIIEELKRKYKISEISENKILKIQEELIKNNKGKVESKMRNIAEKIIKEQNQKLEEYRKEGNLYIVEEDRNGRVYLKDLSINSKYVFEEVDFPKELLDKATEGAIFKYENGNYNFFSNDGFK